MCHAVFWNVSPPLLSSPLPQQGTVEKQAMVYFTVRVTEEIAKDGLALRCMSPNKSRFKLVVSQTLILILIPHPPPFLATL